MENVVKKRYKPSESYNIYEYERTRLEALKHGYFWAEFSKILRLKYKLPKDGFSGATLLNDFYDHYKSELKPLGIKTITDLLVNLNLVINLVSIKEIDLFSTKYNFQREYLYSLFFFNDYKISGFGIDAVLYFNGKDFIPKTDLTKGAYIRYHPLMSKKDLIKAFNIASGITDKLTKTTKSKENIQARLYDKDRLNLYISIETKISVTIRKGIPLRSVLTKVCNEIELTIDDYTDYRDFYEKYIKALNILSFKTKMSAI